MNTFLIAVSTLLLGAAVLVAFVAGRRMVRHTGRVRLIEVMQHRGANLRYPLDEADARYHAHAVRICIACSNRRLCDEHLCAGRPADSYAICPNARYIECARHLDSA